MDEDIGTPSDNIGEFVQAMLIYKKEVSNTNAIIKRKK
jgi:hypothetical protein